MLGFKLDVTSGLLGDNCALCVCVYARACTCDLPLNPNVYPPWYFFTLGKFLALHNLFKLSETGTNG